MNKIVFRIILIAFMQTFTCLVQAESPGEQIGAEEALQLTGHIAPIVQQAVVLDESSRTLSAEEGRLLEETGRLSASREGLIADLENSATSPAQSDCPLRETAKKTDFRIDIEFRAYVMSGYTRGNERTSYSDANFDNVAQNYVRWKRASINGLSLLEAQQKIIASMSTNSKTVSEAQKKEVFDAILRDRIVRAAPAERRSIYEAAGKLMSFDDQIAFVAKLGGEMGDNYDDAKAAAAISATDISTCDEVLTALGTGAKAGVCRDIHMCMGQVLSDMGNKDHVYGISFASPGNYHVTLIASDPNNPNRVHTINYNKRGATNKSGVAAMAQDHSIPDVGISYRLWKPVGGGAGKMVAALPSQIGLVLNEMTGGMNKRDFDPVIREDYSLISAGSGVGPWNARVFSAGLANGDRVLGVATHLNWGNQANPKKGQIFDGVSQSGSVGLAFAHRLMERPNGAEISPMTINTVYLNFQQRVSVPIRLTKNIVIEPNAGFRLQAAVIEGGFEGERGVTGDGDMAFTLGASGMYISDNELTRLRLSVATQLTPGLADIRGLLGSSIILVPNNTYFALDVDQELSAEARLNARLLYVMREYGDTFQATVGAEFRTRAGRTGLNAGFLTPVGTANGFMPGGAHPSLLVGLHHSVLKDEGTTSAVDLRLNYIQQLDSGEYQFNSGVAVHF